MRAVWKVMLRSPVELVPLPPGAVPLTVATQEGRPCVWFEVDTSSPAPRETRMLQGIGTGHPVPDGAVYLGTAHDVEGMGLVFHVYERHDG